LITKTLNAIKATTSSRKNSRSFTLIVRFFMVIELSIVVGWSIT